MKYVYFISNEKGLNPNWFYEGDLKYFTSNDIEDSDLEYIEGLDLEDAEDSGLVSIENFNSYSWMTLNSKNGYEIHYELISYLNDDLISSLLRNKRLFDINDRDDGSLEIVIKGNFSSQCSPFKVFSLLEWLYKSFPDWKAYLDSRVSFYVDKDVSDKEKLDKIISKNRWKFRDPPKVKFWIDDKDNPPDESWSWINGFIVGGGVGQRLDQCFKGDCNLDISLDFYSGSSKEDFSDILKYLENESSKSPEWDKYIKEKIKFYIHTPNPFGINKLKEIIERNNWVLN